MPVACSPPPAPQFQHPWNEFLYFLEFETHEENKTPLKTFLQKGSLVNGKIRDSAIETKEKPALQGKLNAWILDSL